ncbi:MAG: imidazoleglycerol-phosphate dehydratase HisB [Actinobacteria bacterium]|nr:MAG: imidazoleglycerol-phosphate dehydratase HisB [Actinomycetota bacterium]
MARQATIKRETMETQINVELNIDGSAKYKIETRIPFLNHMLELFAKHGLFDLTISAKGDLDVGGHHTVEDVGISLGQAFRRALGEKKQIKRYGYSLLPMDESLAMVALDLAGRSHLVFEAPLPKENIGGFDTSLVTEFLHAFVNHAAMTLHVRLLSGKDTHHMIEAIFKAMARAMDMATQIDERIEGVPSTKGSMDG